MLASSRTDFLGGHWHDVTVCELSMEVACTEEDVLSFSLNAHQ